MHLTWCQRLDIFHARVIVYPVGIKWTPGSGRQDAGARLVEKERQYVTFVTWADSMYGVDEDRYFACAV